jgi:hypothetical protein
LSGLGGESVAGNQTFGQDVAWGIETFIMHVLIPLFVLVDYIQWSRKDNKLSKRKAFLYWSPYVVLYFSITMIIGTMTGWYPYSVLNPAAYGGWVAGYSILLIAIWAFWLMFAVSWNKKQYQ